MLLAPVALPMTSASALPTTEFWADGIAIDTPIPATMNGASIRP